MLICFLIIFPGEKMIKNRVLIPVFLIGPLCIWSCESEVIAPYVEPSKDAGDMQMSDSSGLDGVAIDSSTKPECRKDSECPDGVCYLGQCCPSVESICGKICCASGTICL